MELRNSLGTLGVDPDDDTILHHLESMDPDGERLLELRHDEDRFIRVGFDDAGGLDLEYRDGAIDRHYQVDFSCSTDEVADGFLSYRHGDNRWRTRVEWRRDPRGGEKS